MDLQHKPIKDVCICSDLILRWFTKFVVVFFFFFSENVIFPKLHSNSSSSKRFVVLLVLLHHAGDELNLLKEINKENNIPQNYVFTFSRMFRITIAAKMIFRECNLNRWNLIHTT